MSVSMYEYKRRRLANILPAKVSGRVRRVTGLVVETTPLPLPVGSLCRVFSRLSREAVEAEVVGFRENATLMMPLGEMRGIGPGDKVVSSTTEQVIPVGPHLLGRILDGMGRPMDGKGPIVATAAYPIYADPPDPVQRPRISDILSTGIRAIDAFMTVGKGQRIGIMAGTGVGKSVLLGMLARYTEAQVSVISLVGERGREVRDFIDRDLGEEGMKRSVVVIATSDQPAPVRVKAPFVATAVAEFFRDQGLDVTLLMDTVTRMAMAQRDIGGSIGEVAAAKGYTPSTFALLPRLMERAGRSPQGSITGFYTVLVEGDDMNEPISDAARGILDGHILLSRRLAHRNQYPAVDVLESISRVQSEIVPRDFLQASRRLRECLATFKDAEELINIGAYAPGANPEIDKAMNVMPQLMKLLKQDMNEATPFEETRNMVMDLAKLSEQEVQARRPPPPGPPRR
ncbi:MAG: FliI/YscN family ATPase [Planctomycetota bacterium]|jgi:flagellum-specific ATP synthase|nr:FliI/YscN family ATPase [Planctomycetota bacterium]